MASKRTRRRKATRRPKAQRPSRASNASTDKDSIASRARAREGAKGQPGTVTKAEKSTSDGKPATLHEAHYGRNGDGRFRPGNRIWEARATCGPAPLFADAESLWKACVQYFEWVESNPLYEDQL